LNAKGQNILYICFRRCINELNILRSLGSSYIDSCFRS